MEDTLQQFTRIETKLDAIVERLARIEGSIERHDERTLDHRARIVLLEQANREATRQYKKASVAITMAVLSLMGTLVPVLIGLL